MSLIKKLKNYVALPAAAIAGATLLYACSFSQSKELTIYEGIRRAIVRLEEYPKELKENKRLLSEIQQLEKKYELRIKFLEESIKEDEKIREGVKKLLEGKVEEESKNGN